MPFGDDTRGLAQVGHGGLDRLGAHVADDHDRAFLGELAGGGLPDALGPAGDDADLAFQTHVSSSLV